jgi:hypothetical protein
MTTYRFRNHTVRTEDWRYIRYENGDEELYHDADDPNEWTNLAANPQYAARKAALAKLLPAHDQPDIGNSRAAGGERPAGNRAQRRANRQNPEP